MPKSRGDIEVEAAGLTTAKLTERQQTAKVQCEDFTRRVEEFKSGVWFYTSDDEAAQIAALETDRDAWCLMFEVYTSELGSRRAAAPAETAKTESEILTRRAAERETRREETAKETEEALAAQRERSTIGQIMSLPERILTAPLRWAGLATDQSAEERTLGVIRLALMATALGAAYYFILRPLVAGAAGIAERGAIRTTETITKLGPDLLKASRPGI